VLDGFNPPAWCFKALKAKLAELRSAAPRAEAPDDRIATAAASNPATRTHGPALRQKLGVKSKADDLVY